MAKSDTGLILYVPGHWDSCRPALAAYEFCEIMEQHPVAVIRLQFEPLKEGENPLDNSKALKWLNDFATCLALRGDFDACFARMDNWLKIALALAQGLIKREQIGIDHNPRRWVASVNAQAKALRSRRAK